MTTPTIDDLPPPPSRADPTNFAVRGDAFLGAFPTLVTQINAIVAWIAAAITTILAAAASAVATPNTMATSTDSLTLTIVQKTLTVQAGKTFVASMWVAITSTADGNSWMAGPVVSYNSGTGQLVVDVRRVSGPGTFASWQIVGTTPLLSDTTPRALAAGSTVNDPVGVAQPIGYRGSPVIQVTGSHVLTLADVGCTLELAAGASITIPTFATTAFTPGDAIIIQEVVGATKAITPAAGVTLRQAGLGSSGARTLKAWGQAVIRFTHTNNLVICGGDLT